MRMVGETVLHLVMELRERTVMTQMRVLPVKMVMVMACCFVREIAMILIHYAFLGAAEEENPDACMRDADEDGWEISIPPRDGVAGTDCDDTDASLLNPKDADGDGESTCEGDCDDDDPETTNQDADGDGYTVCDGDLEDDNPAIAFFSPSGATFASIFSRTFEVGSPVEEFGRDGDEVIHDVFSHVHSW